MLVLDGLQSADGRDDIAGLRFLAAGDAPMNRCRIRADLDAAGCRFAWLGRRSGVGCRIFRQRIEKAGFTTGSPYSLGV
jgi:hypothetical protein